MNKWFFYILFLFSIHSLPVLCQELHLVRLTSFRGSLKFGFQSIDEESQRQISTENYSEHFLEGGLDINMSGFCYHPNLVEFNITGDFTSHKSDVSLFNETTTYNSNKNSYNCSLNILKKKIISFEPYFRKGTTDAGKRFMGRYFSTHKTNGLKILSKTKYMPFTLNLYHSYFTYSSLTITEREEVSSNIEIMMNLVNTPLITSNVEVKFKDFKENITGTEYKHSQFLLNLNRENISFFTSRFFATLNAYILDSDNENKNINWVNNFTTYYPHNFISQLNMTYQKNTLNNETLDITSLTGSLMHRLYQNLDSHLQLGWNQESDPAHTLKKNNINLNISYRRSIPTGNIRINLNKRFEKENNTSRSDVSTKSDSFSFDTSDSIMIVLQGIDSSSINLTNLNLSEYYINGIDYTLFISDNSIIINRIPGGNIPSGGSVLIRYSFLSYPDYSLNNYNDSQTFSLRFLKFFEYSYSNQSKSNSIISDYLIQPYESFNRHKSAYRIISRWLNAEYGNETYNGNIHQYTVDNWQISLGKTFFKKLRTSVSVSNNNYNTSNTDQFTEFKNMYASITYISPWNSTFSMVYKDTDYDTESSFNHRESLYIKYRWQLRKLSFEGNYEYILDDTFLQTRTRSNYNIVIRRFF